jgi:hypothetical protein
MDRFRNNLSGISTRFREQDSGRLAQGFKRQQLEPHFLGRLIGRNLVFDLKRHLIVRVNDVLISVGADFFDRKLPAPAG